METCTFQFLELAFAIVSVGAILLTAIIGITAMLRSGDDRRRG